MADILLVDVRKALGTKQEASLRKWYHATHGPSYKPTDLETVSTLLRLTSEQQQTLEATAERREATTVYPAPVLGIRPPTPPSRYWDQKQEAKDPLSVYTIAQLLPPTAHDSFLIQVLEDQESLLQAKELELVVTQRPERARDKIFTSTDAAQRYLKELNKEKPYIVSERSLEAFRKTYVRLEKDTVALPI